jgi:hypothetical protein
MRKIICSLCDGGDRHFSLHNLIERDLIPEAVRRTAPGSDPGDASRIRNTRQVERNAVAMISITLLENEFSVNSSRPANPLGVSRIQSGAAHRSRRLETSDNCSFLGVCSGHTTEVRSVVGNVRCSVAEKKSAVVSPDEDSKPKLVRRDSSVNKATDNYGRAREPDISV